MRRRPDIRAAEYNALAQCAQIGVAKAELYPGALLAGNFGFLASDVGKSYLADMFNWRDRSGSVGPVLTSGISLIMARLPTRCGSRTPSSRHCSSLTKTPCSAPSRTWRIIWRLSATQEQAASLKESVLAAQNSLDLAVIQYREGITDFTTVLTAQQALLSAQDSLASAMGNISRNLVGVYRALGGGWQIREGQEFVPLETRKEMEQRTNWGKLLTPASQPPPTPAEERQKRLIRPPQW